MKKKKRRGPDSTQRKIKAASALAKKVHKCSKSLFKVSDSMTKAAFELKKYHLQNEKKYLQKIKEEMLLQNVFSLDKEIKTSCQGLELTIQIEAISNSLMEIFNISRQYVDGDIIQIGSHQVGSFIIVNKKDSDNGVLRLKILEPGYISDRFVISKPRVEIIRNNKGSDDLDDENSFPATE